MHVANIDFAYPVQSLDSRKPKQTLDDMRKAFRSAMHGRASAITQRRLFCPVPSRPRVNDIITILQGGHVPLILRGQNDAFAKRYELIGETYVHGIM